MSLCKNAIVLFTLTAECLNITILFFSKCITAIFSKLFPKQNSWQGLWPSDQFLFATLKTESYLNNVGIF